MSLYFPGALFKYGWTRGNGVCVWQISKLFDSPTCKLMKIYTIIYFNYINTTVLSLWNDFIYKENICLEVPFHGLSLQIKDVITVCAVSP